jgi:hypothetical protein
MSPTGTPDPEAPARSPLYWEYCTGDHPPGITRRGVGWGYAVRNGSWKGLQVFSSGNESGLFLYDLSSDIGETNDVAVLHPDIVSAFTTYAFTAHTDTTYYPKGDSKCVAN